MHIHGTVISVPLPSTTTQLPASSTDEPPYTIQLIDGSTVRASPAFMEHIIDCQGPFQDIHTLPTWMGNKQKVMYLRDGQYVKGYMLFQPESKLWHFSHQRHNGLEIWGVDLPDLLHRTQQIIDAGTLIPGWHTSTSFNQGLAHHVSAVDCHLSCPGSLHHSMKPNHPDKAIWLVLQRGIQWPLRTKHI